MMAIRKEKPTGCCLDGRPPRAGAPAVADGRLAPRTAERLAHAGSAHGRKAFGASGARAPADAAGIDRTRTAPPL